MASIKQMETKEGKRFFQISVSRGYGKSAYKMRWYWPDGWSKRSAEREAAKQAAQFERACAAGEVLNRAEAKEKAAQEAPERARLKSVKKYGNNVFMAGKSVAFSENARASYQMFLQWSDIDFKAGTMTVRRNLQYTAAKGIYEAAPKSGKIRTVDIGPDVLALLRQLRDEQAGKATTSDTQMSSPRHRIFIHLNE